MSQNEREDKLESARLAIYDCGFDPAGASQLAQNDLAGFKIVPYGAFLCVETAPAEDACSAALRKRSAKA